MKEITIEVVSRHDSGKGVARKLRAKGLIPGVLYGKGEKALAIVMEHTHFHNVMRKAAGENPLVNLTIDGKQSDKKALIRDMQRDPVDGHLMHIDFQQILLTDKIRVRVPIVLEGIPEGVKSLGGIVNWVVRDVEVLCLPADIPENFKIDISALKVHESIHVKSIAAPNVEIQASPEETIVAIVPPTIIKEVTPVVAEGEAAAVVAPVEGEEPSEPEVISEKKAEERKAEREKELGGKEKGGKEKGPETKGAKEKEKPGKEKEKPGKEKEKPGKEKGGKGKD
jgi:large subunit ribosomal protein L25